MLSKNISEIWSSMILFNNEINNNTNSCRQQLLPELSATSETWLHSLLGKQPSHLSHKANCFQFFLTCASQFNFAIFLKNIHVHYKSTFDNVFLIIFCFYAKDLHSNQWCSQKLSLARLAKVLFDAGQPSDLIGMASTPALTGLTENAPHPSDSFSVVSLPEYLQLCLTKVLQNFHNTNFIVSRFICKNSMKLNKICVHDGKYTLAAQSYFH